MKWITHKHETEDTKEDYAKFLESLETRHSSNYAAWKRQDSRRQWQRKKHREPECHGFTDYVRAVRKRLAAHGFTRPFQFHEDPKLQDPLSTWIEYLNFEYWWLDKFVLSIERLKPGFDEAWQDLATSITLEPHETQEYLISDDGLIEVGAERERAQAAVTEARAECERIYALTQLDPNRLEIPKAKRMKMLRAASRRLTEARDHSDVYEARVLRIEKFLRHVLGYIKATEHAARQGDILEWVLAQLHLVEAETGMVETAKGGGSSTAAAPESKERKSASVEDDGASSPRRQKRGRGAPPEPSGAAVSGDGDRTRKRARSAADQAPPGSEAPRPRKRRATSGVSAQTVRASGATPGAPRRSARIASLRGNPSPAAAPSSPSARPPSPKAPARARRRAG